VTFQADARRNLRRDGDCGAFERLRQRLASSATLQPFVRRVVWIWVTAATLLVFGAVGASAANPCTAPSAPTSASTSS